MRDAGGYTFDALTCFEVTSRDAVNWRGHIGSVLSPCPPVAAEAASNANRAREPIRLVRLGAWRCPVCLAEASCWLIYKGHPQLLVAPPCSTQLPSWLDLPTCQYWSTGTQSAPDRRFAQNCTVLYARSS